MKYKLFFLLVLFSLLPLACGRILDNPLTPDMNDSPVSSGDGNPNGGETRSPLDPIEGEEAMSRGEVFIEASELLILESYPLQIMIQIDGNLPTPCHQIRAQMEKPDSNGEIHVELYSLVDPEAICIQMLEAFESNIPLGSFPDGSYSVWLNGVKLGEFKQ